MTAEARRSWVRSMLADVPRPIPKFGSPQWLALPDGDRRKVAGVVVAAESYARDADELEDRLRAEVDALRLADKRADDAEYVARRDAHRESWTGRGFKPDPRQQDQIEAEWREWIGGVA